MQTHFRCPRWILVEMEQNLTSKFNISNNIEPQLEPDLRLIKGCFIHFFTVDNGKDCGCTTKYRQNYLSRASPKSRRNLHSPHQSDLVSLKRYSPGGGGYGTKYQENSWGQEILSGNRTFVVSGTIFNSKHLLLSNSLKH